MHVHLTANVRCWHKLTVAHTTDFGLLFGTKTFKIDEIYVPVKRRKTLNMKVVNEIAESMLEKGQLTPILVRPGNERFVLVEGLHRLEACKALGEETVVGLIVQARRH